MKDRVREAVFNLVGPAVVGSEAIDLFAGTGALGLEAISRGAASAIFIEQHRPTAALIRQNIEGLEVAVPVEVVAADTFYWYRHQAQMSTRPWLVLCSPPFDFFVERRDAMLELVQYFVRHAPSGSVVVVESDERFDPAELPRAGEWLVRRYPPAVVAVLRVP